MKVELSVTDCNLAHKTKVLWFFGLSGAVTKTKPEIILDNDRLAKLFSANREMVNFNHRVVIGVHQSRFLSNALDLGVFDVEQMLRKVFFIEHILHQSDRNGIRVHSVHRGSLAFSIFSISGCCIKSRGRFWLDGQVLLLNELISEDLKPIFKVGHHTVRSSPHLFAISILSVQRELLRVNCLELCIV